MNTQPIKWNLIMVAFIGLLMALAASTMASAQTTITLSCTSIEYNTDTSAYDATVQISIAAGTQADAIQVIVDYPQTHTPSAVVNVDNFALSTFNTVVGGTPSYYAVNAARNAAQGSIDGQDFEVLVMSLAGPEAPAGTTLLDFRNNNGVDESATLAYLTGSLLAVTTENCAVSSPLEPENTAPTIDPIEDVSVANGDAVMVDAEASDPDGDTLTFSATGLPDGVSIDGATGVISFTAANDTEANAVLDITVTVSDGEASATESFSITIAPPDPASVNMSGGLDAFIGSTGLLLVMSVTVVLMTVAALVTRRVN